MDRGLIVGAIAFAAAFAAERLYASMDKDIARYEKLRAMSGQPSILKEIFAGMFGSGGEKNGAPMGAGGLLADLTNDVMRYARMRNM